MRLAYSYDPSFKISEKTKKLNIDLFTKSENFQKINIVFEPGFCKFIYVKFYIVERFRTVNCLIKNHKSSEIGNLKMRSGVMDPAHYDHLKVHIHFGKANVEESLLKIKAKQDFKKKRAAKRNRNNSSNNDNNFFEDDANIKIEDEIKNIIKQNTSKTVFINNIQKLINDENKSDKVITYLENSRKCKI